MYACALRWGQGVAIDHAKKSFPFIIFALLFFCSFFFQHLKVIINIDSSRHDVVMIISHLRAKVSGVWWGLRFHKIFTKILLSRRLFLNLTGKFSKIYPKPYSSPSSTDSFRKQPFSSCCASSAPQLLSPAPPPIGGTTSTSPPPPVVLLLRRASDWTPTRQVGNTGG